MATSGNNESKRRHTTIATDSQSARDNLFFLSATCFQQSDTTLFALLSIVISSSNLFGAKALINYYFNATR